MPLETGEGALVERQERCRHRSFPSGSIARSSASSSSSSRPRIRSASQVVRRARTRFSSRSPSLGQRQPDAAPVGLVADALDQACLLEPVDVAGERRGGDPLLGRQLAQAHPRVVADQPEECHLPAGDAELLGLAPQLARKAQQHGPQLIRDGEGIGDNFVNH